MHRDVFAFHRHRFLYMFDLFPEPQPGVPFERFMDGIKLLEDRKIIGKSVLLM